MDGAAGRSRDLLRVADASRTAGDGDAARGAYGHAYDAARAVGDVETMTRAAVGLAAVQVFGTVPGRVPALLHEAYRLTSGAARARVAVALARAWAYGGEPARGVAFAQEAIAIAERIDDAGLLADALDAQLLVHWGPDDLAARLRITRRMEDVVGLLPDVEPRMTAHLWRLTTALECLDLPAVQRQVRALDSLAEESTDQARPRFFAAARRGMYALLTDDLRAARSALEVAVAAGGEAGEADARSIERLLSAGIARQAGDAAALAREATLYEEFSAAEGIVSIGAEAAVFYLAAGRADQASRLSHQLAGPDLGGVPRDVDWLLTITSLTEVAAATGATDRCAAAVGLLAPYTGRGVANAGAGFSGVVDDYLSRALLALGRTDEADDRRLAAAAAYRRMGAVWWLRRVSASDRPNLSPVEVVHLHPAADGLWTVGVHGATHTVPAMRGLQYLRMLLDRPGADLSALDLSDAAAGHPGRQVADGNAAPLLDRQALTAYRRRLAELDEELAEADDRADLMRSERLTVEREALLAQVAEATGLGGRLRGTTSAGERARVAVRKAIAAAEERVAGTDPGLARLLRATVTTGTCCRYEPDPGRPVQWVLSTGPGGNAGRPGQGSAAGSTGMLAGQSSVIS